LVPNGHLLEGGFLAVLGLNEFGTANFVNIPMDDTSVSDKFRIDSRIGIPRQPENIGFRKAPDVFPDEPPVEKTRQALIVLSSQAANIRHARFEILPGIWGRIDHSGQEGFLHSWADIELPRPKELLRPGFTWISK
jgi:hypothetical protein